MSERYNSNEDGFRTLIAILKFNVRMETMNVSERYDLDRRLSPDQKELFEAYFSAYRVTRDRDNSEMLDATTNSGLEAATRLPIMRPLVGFVHKTARSVAIVSEEMHQRAQELAESYKEKKRAEYEGSEHLGDETFPDYLIRQTSPTKLQITANVLNFILVGEGTKKEIRNRAEEYLNRQLPVTINNSET